MPSTTRPSPFTSSLLVYPLLLVIVTGIAAYRVRHAGDSDTGTDYSATITTADPDKPAKPYFSLSTNRSFATNDHARVVINYQNVDHLDFRVYRVKDPVKFFKKLNNPHQLGDSEKEEVSNSYQRKPTLLEKLRNLKRSIYGAIKDYFRYQLKRDSRTTFNQKFRGEGERLPLNVADYARVPLLNPDQLVGSWREMLSPLDEEYDTRMVTLGEREAGVYLVEAVNGDLRAYTIAMVTDLTTITKTSSNGQMFVYAADRRTGAPRPDVRVYVTRKGADITTGVTDRNGILRTEVVKKQPAAKPTPKVPAADVDPGAEGAEETTDSYLVMATNGDQFTISDLEPYYFGENSSGEEYDEEGEAAPDSSNLTSYIYTDRPVYRPDQKVYFKGILRRLTETGYENPGGRKVMVTITDPNEAQLSEKELTLTPRGTFSGDVDIAAGAPLGSYSIKVVMGNKTASTYFEVQEYKKPEYKVSVTASKKFAAVGEKVKFDVEARYFFGSPVTKADVQYYIYRSRYYPWWWHDEDDAADFGMTDGEEDSEGGGGYGYGEDMVKDGTGTLDANGHYSVEFEVPKPDEKESWDYTYRLEAQVTDSSRRTIEGKASFTGTRGQILANVRTDRYVYYQGDTAKIAVKTTDYEGRPMPANVTLKFVQQKWELIESADEDNSKYKHYESKLHEKELSQINLNTNEQGEGSYDYQVPLVGSIYIKTIINENGKEITANGDYIWSADRNNSWADFTPEDAGEIKLVLDKKSYKPGETAHVLATLPTDGAHLLVTTELTNVLTAQHVEAKGRAVMIDVPIEPRYAPNVYLSVSYIKDGEMYTHDRLLAVPARDKLLNIEILQDKKEYKPRETANYTVFARNADGSPASGAEISLGVVDEAIYSIRPDTSGDIRKDFYGRRANSVQTSVSLLYYFSGFSGAKPVDLAKKRASYQLADFKNESQLVEPTIRKDFKDTAFWQPNLVTGADGKASVKVQLPDNLTTWRATARAVTTDTRVGGGIGKVIARKDVIMRLETPRFMTEGDTVTLSGIVHNYLDASKATEISLEVTGANLIGQAQQVVTIPKQGEQRIDWKVAAADVGEVKMLAKARTDTESDAVELTIPIVPHGLTKTVGGAQSFSDDEVDKTIDLNIPGNAGVAGRNLRVEVAPSIAGTLFGALDYLTSYPYGCTEQTMSSFLPNVIVAQALKNVKAATIRGTNDLAGKVGRGLDRLYSYQHDDGGWGWWKNDKTDPFMTAYVVDGLAMAGRVGQAINNDRLNQGRTKLHAMLESGKDDDGKPIDQETRAYMVYALGESGQMDARFANDLYNNRSKLQPYGRALLALTLNKRGDDGRAREVAGEIEGTARAGDFDAHWESRLKPMLDFVETNDTEATAFSVKALAKINPQSALLPKAARWLASNRRNGRYWVSTKQTAFAILGLLEYLKVSRELTPDYAIEVYLNGEQVLARRMTAAEATSGAPFVFERKAGAVAGNNQVRVVKHGGGMLYLSTSLEYFTKEDNVQPQATADLRLTREYLRLRVDESGDKPKWVTEPLTGEVRSGDLLVSRLHLEGARARYLMIEDPIPAGCEQIEGMSGINLDYTDGRWTDWYSAREFRDQKTVLFVYSFDGKATYQYAMRVQVPGDFRVAPARAEQMYQPTVQSNTANSVLKITDRQ